MNKLNVFIMIQTVQKDTIEITGEEYARWGENDDYLGVICLQKINPADKIAEVVTPAPSSSSSQ